MTVEDFERYEIARLFSIDPGSLRKLPRSEFRKRRAYWQLWRKANRPAGEEDDSAHPYTVKEWSNLPQGARVIE